MRIEPEIEKVYGQLLWIERRRQRIIAAVSSHFGGPTVHRYLKESGIETLPLADEPTFGSLLDERDPPDFLSALAESVLTLESRTITVLRKKASAYPKHTDEQILFGARTAGQEAGRTFMARNHPADANAERLALPEAIQAVLELSYLGLPGEKNYFLCLREHGGSTVHFSHSPILRVWASLGSDTYFLNQLKNEWILGTLDILSPAVAYSSPRSLEEGHIFGLAQFHLRGVHAGP